MRSTVRSIIATLALAAISAVPSQAQAQAELQSTTSRARSSDAELSALASIPTAVALRYRAPMPPAVREAAATSSDRVTDTPAPTPSGFASTGFAQFMSSSAGRIARVIAGAGMIAGGIAMDSDGGTALAIAGGVPLFAGTFDFCVLSPLFGGPFWGKDIRAAK